MTEREPKRLRKENIFFTERKVPVETVQRESIDSLPFSVMMIDSKARIIGANKTSEDIFGLAKNQLLGLNISNTVEDDLLFGYLKNGTIDYYNQVRAYKYHSIEDKEQSEKWISYTLSGVKNTDGKRKFIVLAEDVTNEITNINIVRHQLKAKITGLVNAAIINRLLDGVSGQKRLVESSKKLCSNINKELKTIDNTSNMYLQFPLDKDSIKVAESIPSEKNIAEESLLQEEEKQLEDVEFYNFVFKNLSTGLSFLDDEGNIMLANPAFQKIQGLSQKVLNHLNYPYIVSGKNTEWVDNLNGGIITKYDIHRSYGKGKYKKDLRISFLKNKNPQGGFVSIVRDVTQEAKTVNNLREELTSKQILRLRKQCFSLNQRIKQIKGDRAILLNQRANSLVQSAETLLLFSESLLQYPLTVEKTSKEPIRIDQILADTLNSLQSAIIENEIKVNTNLSEMPYIVGNKSSLTSSFTNIIINAIHAMQGAPIRELSILCSTEKYKDRIEIQISDTGTGIPSEISDKIWDFRFSTKRGTDKKGEGIGLFEVATTIKEHFGTITHTSTTKGKTGTTFIITLPYQSQQL